MATAQYGAQTASGGVHEGNIPMETQLRMGQYKMTVFCTITRSHAPEDQARKYYCNPFFSKWKFLILYNGRLLKR